MAITSIGYDGSVNESQWSKMIPSVGSSQYGVLGAGDWKVTPHATMDRGINIATGGGWGHGVLDDSNATVSLQATAVSSGDRWDMVVMRRNWSGTGGVSTFVIIQGTATKLLPSRNTTPGTIDDQPLALVRFRAGQTAAQEIVDLRCWARNGGMTARDDLALMYLKMPGSQIMINGVQWNCELDANGNPTWTTFRGGYMPIFGVSSPLIGDAATAGGQFLVQAGTNVNYADGSGYSRVVFPKPFPNGVLTVMGFNGDDWATGGSMFYASAGNVGGGNGYFGQDGYASRTDWVYAVLSQDPGSKEVSRWWGRNRIHRINWIAIGW